MHRTTVLLLGALMITHSVTAEKLPGAEAALEAYAAYKSDPFHRLDRTQPFLDFIQTSGRVHIVLNDALLAWMYDELDPHYKAVLYAGFLGGNMAGQLNRDDQQTGTDNVGGMRGALAAYTAIQTEDPTFSLPLFEQLRAAEDDGTLAASVERLAAGTSTP